MSNSFVAQVRAQSWYPQVAAAMSNAGVPEAVWISVIKSEDVGAVNNPSLLNVPTQEPDGTQSWGLFQNNQNPRAADPAYAATIDAPRMSAALQNAGPNATPTQIVQALEVAGWPGSATDKYGRAEFPARLANYQQTLADEATQSSSIVASANSAATTPVSGAFAPYLTPPVLPGYLTNPAAIPPSSPLTSSSTSSSTSSTDPTKDEAWWQKFIIDPITKTVNALALQSLQVAIALAIIAGGFALLTSPSTPEAPGPA